MASKLKPSDVADLAKSLIEAARERDELYDAMDALYDQERFKDEKGDDSVSLVQVPYAPITIDLATDFAAQMKLTITVPAAKEHAKAKQEADDAEAWLQAWLTANERMQGRNLTADMAWFGAQRSLVVLRTLFLESLVEKDDDEAWQINQVPVLLHVRDPRYVYYREGALGVECVVEAFERTAGDIRRKYPGALKNTDHDDEEMVQWIEYWDDTYRCYLADGEPVKIKGMGMVPHGYGCLPYAIGVARSTPRAAAGKRVRPLLSSTQSLLNSIDIGYSIMTTAAQDSVTNAWGVFSDSYGANQQKSLSLTPDSINYFAPNDKVEPIQRAPLPSDFFQTLNQLIQVYQMATFPFAVYGQAAGNMAGYTVNLLQQSGRRPLIPIWDAIERAYEGAMRNCVTICREKVAPLVGDDLPLMVARDSGDVTSRRQIRRTLLLNTKAFGHDFEVNVELSDPMPADEAQNLRLALEATKGGLLSRETALTKYKISGTPTAEMLRMAAEKGFDTLAPIETIRLARERGLLPTEIKMPAGFTGFKGQAVPTVLMGADAPQAQPQMPQGMPPQMAQPQPMPQPGPQVMEQAMPMPQPGMEQGLPPGMTPEMYLQMLMQQAQGGQPVGTNPVAMQSISAEGLPPNLNELSGVPPPYPLPIPGAY